MTDEILTAATGGFHEEPPVIKPCNDCGRPIALVRSLRTGNLYPAETYDVNGETRADHRPHRCALTCGICGGRAFRVGAAMHCMRCGASRSSSSSQWRELR